MNMHRNSRILFVALAILLFAVTMKPAVTWAKIMRKKAPEEVITKNKLSREVTTKNMVVIYPSLPEAAAKDSFPGKKNGPLADALNRGLPQRDCSAATLFCEVWQSVKAVEETQNPYLSASAPLESFPCRPQSTKEKAVALVMGNNAYSGASSAPLQGAVPDAHLVSKALRDNGFQVKEHYDIDKTNSLQAIKEFSDMMKGAEIAVIYYSGYGFSWNNKRFLLTLPGKQNEQDLESVIDTSAVWVGDILQAVEQATPTWVYVVFDTGFGTDEAHSR